MKILGSGVNKTKEENPLHKFRFINVHILSISLTPAPIILVKENKGWRVS